MIANREQQKLDANSNIELKDNSQITISPTRAKAPLKDMQSYTCSYHLAPPPKSNSKQKLSTYAKFLRHTV
jgi:hypothetical protein